MSTDFYFIWNVCNLFILFDIKVYAVPPSFLIRFANKRSTFLIYLVPQCLLIFRFV